MESQLIHLQLPTSGESSSSVLAAATLAAMGLLLAALAHSGHCCQPQELQGHGFRWLQVDWPCHQQQY
jgi:hypothetical protein